MKTKTTHTPGPWDAKDMGPKYGGWSIEHTIHIAAGKSCDALTGRDLPAHDTHPRIARVLSGMGADSHAEGQANARLIAAAPELLEAAKNAYRDLLRQNNWSIHNGGLCPDNTSGETLDGLRAAIAKAEGK